MRTSGDPRQCAWAGRRDFLGTAQRLAEWWVLATRRQDFAAVPRPEISGRPAVRRSASESPTVWLPSAPCC